MKTYGYHIFPPFIDAYRQGFNGKEKRTLKDIKRMLISHSVEWGEKSVGHSILSRQDAAMYNSWHVVGCARVFNEKGLEMELVAVVIPSKSEKHPYWFEHIRVTEGVQIIQPEWDVT